MPAHRKVFADASTPTLPKLEFVFEVRLYFQRMETVGEMPSGAGRGAVYVDGGTFEGPKLRGKVTPSSGGDWSLFRPDDVLSFDARYMLVEEDGTPILLYNSGYLWGREEDTLQKMREFSFEGGPDVPFEEYYFRTFPRFEVAKGKHDWLMRHAIIGIGERKRDGNLIRYFAVL